MDQQGHDPNPKEPNRETGTAPETTPGGTESEQNLPAQRRPVGSGEVRPEQGSAEKPR